MEIKKWRDHVGLTQVQAAKAIDISTMTFARYEAGTRQPRAAEIIKMAQLFGCTPDDILLDRHPQPPHPDNAA